MKIAKSQAGVAAEGNVCPAPLAIKVKNLSMTSVKTTMSASVDAVVERILISSVQILISARKLVVRMQTVLSDAARSITVAPPTFAREENNGETTAI